MNDDSAPIAIHWFRRDLRLDDNPSLEAAHASGLPVVALFIFDREILDELPRQDARVQFIHQRLGELHAQIESAGGTLLVKYGNPAEVFQELITSYTIKAVHTNRDYEPYATQRDREVSSLLERSGISFTTHQDHLLLEPGTILKQDGTPYSVFTPFKKRWLEVAETASFIPIAAGRRNWAQLSSTFPTLESIGFEPTEIQVLPSQLDRISDYRDQRNHMAEDTTLLGPHLRFGTISIRRVHAQASDQTFLSQLIWREFFAHILFHHPRVVHQSFRPEYDRIEWRNDPEEFQLWCEGRTGYPLVDAGMRQLNRTGYIHNRARMVVASFLCKHLLIDWRWGEQYFAQKLLDFELASNNGSWQWAAGTGCDAAPYFRVFNPKRQMDRFDPDHTYIKRWVEDLQSLSYPAPMVDHSMARKRAIETYKVALSP